MVNPIGDGTGLENRASAGDSALGVRLYPPSAKCASSSMVEQLAFQLRTEKWLTSTIVVKIRYSNFDTETKQCRIPYTSADHTLLKYVLELFKKGYTRRMRIRLIGVKFTGLVQGCHQMNLFEDTEELISLYQTMDKIKNRFGAASVGRASGLLK